MLPDDSRKPQAYLLDAEFIAHCLDLIPKVVGMEHPGSTFRLAASHRGKSLVLFCEGNLYVNLLQFGFRHSSRPSYKSQPPKGT